MVEGEERYTQITSSRDSKGANSHEDSDTGESSITGIKEGTSRSAAFVVGCLWVLEGVGWNWVGLVETGWYWLCLVLNDSGAA
jgi:hypothetical protein